MIETEERRGERRGREGQGRAGQGRKKCGRKDKGRHLEIVKINGIALKRNH